MCAKRGTRVALVSLDKTYRTQNGMQVRLYAIVSDDPDYYDAVHGAYLDGSLWRPMTWNIFGMHYHTKRSWKGEAVSRYWTMTDDGFDLQEVRRQYTMWGNVYPVDEFAPYVRLFETRKQADENALESRVACIELTFEEGEGL